MPALAQIPTQRQAVITVGGHQMSALMFNLDKQSTPVVFIHGITSSVFFWGAGQNRYIKDNLRWYSLSLPGHYPARFPASFTETQLTAEHIAHVTAESIRKLTDGRPVILGGHSTGGFSAVNMAIHHPELVEAVFSIGGFAHGRWTGVLGVYQWLARRGAVGEWLFRRGFELVGSSRELYKAALRFYAADAPAMYAVSSLEESIDDTYAPAAQLDLDAMLMWFRQMPQTDISERLGEIQVPMLLIVGDADPIVPPAQSYLMHERVPHSTLKVYPGAGHLPFAERETLYNTDLAAWLREQVEG